MHKELDKNRESVKEAINLLKDKTISDEQKLSFLLDWQWSYEEIIELALLAD